MPNNITNRLTLICDEDRRREILEAIQIDDKGLGSIDFNKIIPMPPDIKQGDLSSSEYGNGKLDNWYDWCVAKWDTKWNSYGYESFPPYEGGSEICFYTANSRPEPVIQRLSEMYPDVQFQHAWADEDIGMNVGEITYVGGEQIEYDVPSGGSKEAYEMAASVMDIELADYDLHYDEETGTYEYVEAEFASIEMYISPDFQCDATEGYPTSLCWDKAHGMAFLQLNTSLAEPDDDLEYYEKLCSKFGEKPCEDWDDFNSILETLGEDAVHSAWVQDDDESEEMGGMSLQ